MRFFITALILILSLTAIPAVSAGLLFYQEEIAITLQGSDTVSVKGVYFFRNAGTTRLDRNLFYPFPVDSCLYYPFFISIDFDNDTEKVFCEGTDKGVVIPIVISPKTEKRLVVNYRQKAKCKQGRYILLSTASWEKPLEKARYSLRLSAPAALESISYACDSVKNRQGDREYYFHKTKFMPDKDLIFRWK